MRRHQVFVYGTLKRGQRNACFLEQAEYLGDFVTEKHFWMYEFDDYPAVCRDGRHAIYGEIYRIDDTEFATLDELEWYPRFYQRILIPTDFGQAWMYIVQPELCHGRKKLRGRWR
jgi:gamma-glutamylcyclotransferase (GGCT)/AIG2-like uncharacterized protein YtfP